MKKNLYTAFLLLFGVIVIIWLSGCSEAWYQRRDIKKLDALAIQQNSEFLRLSAELNPCFQGKAKSDTTVVFSAPDTVIYKGDTTTSFRHDTITRIIRLPQKVITNQKLVTIHDTVPDTRQITTLQDQNKNCLSDQLQIKQQLTDSQKTAKSRLYWLIGLIIVIVAYAAIKIYLLVSGGAIAKIL